MSKISYIKSIDNSQQNINFKRAFKGVLISIFVNIALLILLAVIITYSNLEIDYAPLIGKSIFYLGAFLSGFFSSLGIKNNGWILGLLSGIVYSLTILLFGALASENFSFKLSLITTPALAIILGVIGGIAGINVRIKKRK
ncbi:MAG: TIGR04086 family membrane protein [Clostridia bacterium]|nr:TIGR04086 family membrane protein [Clostridia bacterium]